MNRALEPVLQSLLDPLVFADISALDELPVDDPRALTRRFEARDQVLEPRNGRCLHPYLTCPHIYIYIHLSGFE